MTLTPTSVHRRLTDLSRNGSLDAALDLFATLGYQYADELPVPTSAWPDGVRDLLKQNADPPMYLAQHRDFRVVYTHLTTVTKNNARKAADSLADTFEITWRGVK